MIPTIFISPSYYIANRHKKTLVEIKFNFLLTQFLGFLNYSRRHFRDYVTGYFRSHVDTFPYLCARCVAIKLPGCVINTRLKVISSAPRLAVQRLLILFFFFFFLPQLCLSIAFWPFLLACWFQLRDRGQPGRRKCILNVGGGINKPLMLTWSAGRAEGHERRWAEGECVGLIYEPRQQGQTRNSIRFRIFIPFDSIWARRIPTCPLAGKSLTATWHLRNFFLAPTNESTHHPHPVFVPLLLQTVPSSPAAFAFTQSSVVGQKSLGMHINCQPLNLH